MFGVPAATELMMTAAALIGAATTMLIAVAAFWRKVVRPIRENIKEELEAWTDMREAVSTRFDTDLGPVGMSVAMRHLISSLAAIEARLEVGDRRFEEIHKGQEAAVLRSDEILTKLEVIEAEQVQVRLDLQIKDTRKEAPDGTA